MNNAIKNTSEDERKIVEMIFEPFVSLETKFSVVGTGIGLHLCRTIINRHNGKIKAQSNGLGKGATFAIDLPIVKSDDK